MRLCKHNKMSSIASIKYFLEIIIQQMKEIKMLFIYFLIKIDFLDMHSYFLPTNQNVLLTTHY